MTNIALIFDLDETILPSGAVPDDTFNPLQNAIRNANEGALSDNDLEKAFEEMKRISIDVVAEEYGFSKKMNLAAKESLIKTDYQFQLSPFNDYKVIQELPGLKFLVTTGVTKFQQAKIDALNIQNHFEEVIIDDIYQPERLGKKKIFSRIAHKYQLTPEQVWIIGDNPDSEIKAGIELGMNTVQRLSKGMKVSENANYTISSFYELKEILNNKLPL